MSEEVKLVCLSGWISKCLKVSFVIWIYIKISCARTDNLRKTYIYSFSQIKNFTWCTYISGHTFCLLEIHQFKFHSLAFSGPRCHLASLGTLLRDEMSGQKVPLKDSVNFLKSLSKDPVVWKNHFSIIWSKNLSNVASNFGSNEQ